MAMNLTQQVRSIADVTRAVAEGDLSRKIDVQVKGEMLDLKVHPGAYVSLSERPAPGTDSYCDVIYS